MVDPVSLDHEVQVGIFDERKQHERLASNGRRDDRDVPIQVGREVEDGLVDLRGQDVVVLAAAGCKEDFIKIGRRCGSRAEAVLPVGGQASVGLKSASAVDYFARYYDHDNGTGREGHVQLG
jgi:hypothetical protein